MASLHQISKYYQSFSGTDTLAFILLPGCKPVVLGALTTISYSVYRNKKPVINIGRTNINGVTRGSRIFAGTMIFTLIHQHWFREVQEELQEQFPLLANIKDLKVDEIPLFDIMIVSANEYGNAVSMYIYGIDFTDEAQTISVEDLFTENTFSFVARDISTFNAYNTLYQVNGDRSNATVDPTISQRFYIMHSDTDIEGVLELDRLYQSAQVTIRNEDIPRRYQNRELYYSPSLTRLMVGDDVAMIQALLSQSNDRYKISDDEYGTFTKLTSDAVRYYQASHGLDPTGVVDERTYISLVSQSIESPDRYATCTNRNGAIVYTVPDRGENITGLGHISYGDSIVYTNIVIGEDGEKYYETEEGYISFNDMYSPDNTDTQPVEYPVLSFGDYGNYVAMLQSLLHNMYPEFVGYSSGYYDQKTKDYVLKFKEEHGIPGDDDKITYDVWMALRAEDNSIFTEASYDGFFIEVTKAPGQYEAGTNNLLEILGDFNVEMYANSSTPVKISVIMNYEDESSKTDTKTIDVKDLTSFSFKEYKQDFVYDPEHGNPVSVDFIVYPYNKQAYKWSIDYNHEKEG